MLSSEVVRYRVEGAVAVLTIARPHARNAIDGRVAQGIESALDLAEADPEIRVVVLAGEPPHFCAGADLKVVADGRHHELHTDRGGFAGIVQRDRSKPVVAAVEGAALAGGLEIVLACDLVVASTDARFGLPEVQRGLIAAGGGAFRLGRRVPVSVAMEMVLTGDPITAADALRHGLVNALCEPGLAERTARDLAARIACNAPTAVGESRRLVADATFADDADAWRRSLAGAQIVLASGEGAEAIRGFFERRPAREPDR
jgi:enoyl-CoA hydratase